jgi:hypothetical protein
MPLAVPEFDVRASWQGGAVVGGFTIGSSAIGGADTLTSSWLPDYGGAFGSAYDILGPGGLGLVRSVSWERGRNDLLSGLLAGEATVELNDPDGVFNPKNPLSPLAGSLVPLRPAYIRALADGPGGSLTVSGNEITDALRALGVQGDGRTSDSSFGVWEATTNLVTNGGVESNTTGWAGNGATISRSQEQTKFGAWVLKAVHSANFGETRFTAAAYTVGQVYTASIWIYRTEVTQTLAFQVRNATNSGSQGTVTIPATLGWQRVAVTFTATTATGNIRVTDNTNNGVFPTYYVDGLQLELQPLATPYVETNGATATRNAARVQAPASLIDETQGWVAMRVRMGWPSTAQIHSSTTSRFWEWGDDSNNRLILYYEAASDNFAFQRRTTAGSQSRSSAAQVFAAGDAKTVIVAWDAATVKISIDGGAFLSAAGTPQIPVLADALFDIGSGQTNNEHADSDFLWFACGTGTLTDADAATLHALGNTGPINVRDLPGDATAVWHADTATYLIPTTHGCFRGFIREYTHNARPVGSTTTLRLTDLFIMLDQARPTISSTGPTTTGAAIGAILDDIGFTIPSFRDLDTGDPIPDFEADGSRSALQLIGDLLTAERGVFFIDADGVAVYQDRYNRARRRTSDHTFSTDIRAISSGASIDNITNRARVTRQGGTEQEHVDTESVALYGYRDATSITTPYLTTDSEALQLAKRIVERGKDPRSPLWRFELVNKNETTLTQQLAREFGDRITVTAASESGTAGDFHIEQLRVEAEQGGHVIRSSWVLSERTAADQSFQIGTSTIGSTDTLSL